MIFCEVLHSWTPQNGFAWETVHNMLHSLFGFYILSAPSSLYNRSWDLERVTCPSIYSSIFRTWWLVSHVGISPTTQPKGGNKLPQICLLQMGRDWSKNLILSQKWGSILAGMWFSQSIAVAFPLASLITILPNLLVLDVNWALRPIRKLVLSIATCAITAGACHYCTMMCYHGI